MTATIISTTGNYPFGQMTNQMTSRLMSVAAQMGRLQEAIATASSGYTGTPGTEFEAPVQGATGAPASPTNLFGVVPDPDNPGAKGSDYAYAVNSLQGVWATFWDAARPFIEQLDNGSTTV